MRVGRTVIAAMLLSILPEAHAQHACEKLKELVDSAAQDGFASLLKPADDNSAANVANRAADSLAKAMGGRTPEVDKYEKETAARIAEIRELAPASLEMLDNGGVCRVAGPPRSFHECDWSFGNREEAAIAYEKQAATTEICFPAWELGKLIGDPPFVLGFFRQGQSDHSDVEIAAHFAGPTSPQGRYMLTVRVSRPADPPSHRN